MRSWPSTRSQQDNSQAESSSMNNSDSVVVSKAGVAASSSSSQLQQQQQPLWYHPQQLLPSGTSVPRRGSLPISRSQLRQLQLEGRLKKRPPSTEIYVSSDRTRLDDTPEQIRKFLDTIKLNGDNSEEDEEVFVESRSNSRSNSLKLKNKKRLNGASSLTKRRGSDLTSSSLKRSSSSTKTVGIS